MKIARVLVVGVLSLTGQLAAQKQLLLGPLIEEALRNNPQIKAAQKQYEAARQRPDRESSLPDPEISFGYTSNGSPLPFAGLGVQPTSNAGLMIAQEFPLASKRKLRGDIAAREADAAFEEYRAARLMIVSQLKQAYFRLAYARALAGLLQRNRELARELISVAEARYAAGQAAQQDIFQAHTQLSLLEARIAKAEQLSRSAEAEINWLLGRAPETSLPSPPEISSGRFQGTLEQLYRAARENSPRLRRETVMLQRAELALNLSRKEYYPDYSVSAGYFTMGRMPDMYEFRVGIRVPLYFWRKQRADVAEQVHRLAQARHELESAEQWLHFQVRDNYLMATTSQQLMDHYTEVLLPQARLAWEAALVAYQSGAVDFQAVLSSFLTALSYEESYYEELLNFHIALVRLEELTGMELIYWVR